MVNKDRFILAIFVASRLFNNLNLYKKILNGEKNRLYSFDGLNIYDFSRRGYARIFPFGKNKFNIFDFVSGNNIIVTRLQKNKLKVSENNKEKILNLNI